MRIASIFSSGSEVLACLAIQNLNFSYGSFRETIADCDELPLTAYHKSR